jgi:hypothetical protein
MPAAVSSDPETGPPSMQLGQSLTPYRRNRARRLRFGYALSLINALYQRLTSTAEESTESLLADRARGNALRDNCAKEAQSFGA